MKQHKHQSKCYRIVGGLHYTNYSDLCEPERETEIVEEAKRLFKRVRIMYRGKGLRAVFVSNE